MNKINKVIWSRRGMLIAALVGLFAAGYLFYTYTSGAELKCGPVHGCDLVRYSEWSSFMGMPTPAFGVFFYLAVIAILLFRVYRPDYKIKLMRWAQIIFAVAGFTESFILTLIQRFVIKDFCSWCLTSAAAASFIFLFMWYDRALELDKETAFKELKLYFYTILIALIAGVIAFSILIRPSTKSPVFEELNPAPPTTIFPIETSTSTPEEPQAEELVALSPNTPIQGPASSKVTLIEFLDYQCPACGMYHNTVILPIREKYKDRIRYAIRQFPLPDLHPNAMDAAIASVCADAQNKFFEMSDLMFENQNKLATPDLIGYANQLGLDVPAFSDCLGNPDARKKVLFDRDAGNDLGVTGTPTLIINNAMVEGTPNFEALSKIIEERL
ncbi:MAG: thioredoxin domain-containing protein [Patescibacteria group bacterium]